MRVLADLLEIDVHAAFGTLGRRRLAGFALAATCVACTQGRPAQRPWELDVPEGLPVHAYAPATDADRAGNHIRFAEDLVIGSEDDPTARFYRVADVATDAQGRIFVLDWQEKHVRVYTADGAYVATLGRPGEGPGEFRQPSSLLADDQGRIYVMDLGDNRVSVWGADLGHVEDIRPSDRLFGLMRPRADGSFLVSRSTFLPDSAPTESNQRLQIAVMSPSGEVGTPIVDVDVQNIPTVVRGRRMSYFSMNPRAHPNFVARPGGGFFLTLSGEYQVIAYDGAGTAEWAVTVPVAPERLPEDLVDHIFETVRERMPDLGRSELILADHLPVIRSLNVDAAGRLYVYPFTIWDPEDPPDTFPVDVYDRDGERIFTGTIDRGRWRDARGAYLYAPTLDDDTDEYRVVRWSPIAPFLADSGQ